MVIINTQTLIPSMQAEAFTGAGREKSPESFLSIFDKSLSQTASAVREQRGAIDGVKRPMQSERTVANGKPKVEKAVASESNPVTDRSPSEAGKDQLALKAEESSPAKEPAPAAHARTDEADNARQTDEDETASPEQMIEQSEQLLAIMDAIIALLQQASTANGTEAGEGASAGSPESFPVQELEGLLEDLTETAQKLQGTKTSELALRFAEKLQKLLGESSFEELMQQTIEISVTGTDPMNALAGKMLTEAENAKLHLVQTSLTEIVLPAMESSETVAAPMTGQFDDNPETETETPENEGKAELTMAKSKDVPHNETEFKPVQNRANLGEVRENPEKQEPLVVESPAYDFFRVNQQDAPAETMKAQPILNRQVVAQVVEKAQMVIREDKSEMVMQLKPESLGKIVLKVIHERGEIIARFVAESEQVKAILESNLQLLKDSLQKSGVAVQSLEVSVGQHGQEQQQDSRRQYEGTAEREPIRVGLPKERPALGYGSSVGGQYYGEAPEIDLTA